MAEGVGSADPVAQAGQEGVELLKGDGHRELRLHGSADGFVGALGVADPSEDPTGVGVHHEAGIAPGVGRHRVGGLLPDARDGEKPPAGLDGAAGEETVQRSCLGSLEPIQHEEDAPGLLAEEAGRSDAFPKAILPDPPESGLREGRLVPEGPDGLAGVRPVDRLGEDCPEENFEGALPRPPPLGAEAAEKAPVEVGGRNGTDGPVSQRPL